MFDRCNTPYYPTFTIYPDGKIDRPDRSVKPPNRGFVVSGHCQPFSAHLRAAAICNCLRARRPVAASGAAMRPSFQRSTCFSGTTPLRTQRETAGADTPNARATCALLPLKAASRSCVFIAIES